MPVIAYCCYQYGWTLQECLALPLRTLFAFMREARKLEAARSFDKLRIAAVGGIRDIDYFNYWKDYYQGIIDPSSLEARPSEPFSEKNREGARLNTETKNKLIAMFSKGKQHVIHGR